MSCTPNFETASVGCPAAEHILEELGIAKVESEIIPWESKDEQMIFD